MFYSTVYWWCAYSIGVYLHFFVNSAVLTHQCTLYLSTWKIITNHLHRFLITISIPSLYPCKGAGFTRSPRLQLVLLKYGDSYSKTSTIQCAPSPHLHASSSLFLLQNTFLLHHSTTDIFLEIFRMLLQRVTGIHTFCNRSWRRMYTRT